jgi:hypothetical protein
VAEARYSYDFCNADAWVRRTPQQERLQPLSLHPLVIMKGTSSFSVHHDSLHCLEQGPVLHLLGSIMKLLCYHSGLPGEPADVMSQIWEQILSGYSELNSRTRMTHMQLSMICDPKKPHAKWPVLKAKAAEARHLLPVFLEFLGNYAH